MQDNKRPAELLATLGAERLAEIIVRMALPAGTETRWDSGTIERVLNPLYYPFKDLGIAWIGDTGADDENLRYWLVEDERQSNPDWKLINYFIDLGQRTIEQGYIDSITLIKNTLVHDLNGPTVTRLKLEEQYKSDLMQIEDSGNDEGTAEELLEEWQERAEKKGLSAYAEEGTYYVTNLRLGEDY